MRTKNVKITKPETKHIAGVAVVTVAGCRGKGPVDYRISYSFNPKENCVVQIYSINLADTKTKDRNCIVEMMNALTMLQHYIDMARFPSVYNLPLSFNAEKAREEILGYLNA